MHAPAASPAARTAHHGRRSTPRPRRVLVVGGGYAGVLAARTAADAGAEVLVLDPTGRHDFLPRLATVAAGGGPADDASAPLTDLLHGIAVAPAAVTAVDVRAQVVTAQDGTTHPYDALVVAAGAQARPPAIPGLAEHGWTLRTADDALRLRDRLAAAEQVVVVGAGSTGTQLAGELAHARPGTRISLVEMTHRILPSLPEGMAGEARAVLEDRGVEVLTGRSLARVEAHGAVLDGGLERPGPVVWTGGFATDGAALLPDAPLHDGRVVVDACAVVPDHGPVLAAGDLAAHRGPGGRVLPQTAQVAVRAGKLAGANAARLVEGRRPRPGTLRHIGWVLPLGGGRAVAQFGPVVLADGLTSRVAPLLHDVIDARHLLTVGGLPAVVEHHQQPLALSR